MATSGYTPISILVSDTAEAVPTTTDLTVYGEMAINVTDKKIYARDNANNIVLLGDYNHTHLAEDITDLTTYILSRSRPQVRTETSTAWTIDADDEYHMILCDNASDILVTVPADADDNLPIGFTCHLHQKGAGMVTIQGDSGVSVNSSRSLVTDAQYSALSLFKVAADDWVVVGDQE